MGGALSHVRLTVGRGGCRSSLELVSSEESFLCPGDTLRPRLVLGYDSDNREPCHATCYADCAERQPFAVCAGGCCFGRANLACLILRRKCVGLSLDVPLKPRRSAETLNSGLLLFGYVVHRIAAWRNGHVRTSYTVSHSRGICRCCDIGQIRPVTSVVGSW
jgi:hypothetical protein